MAHFSGLLFRSRLIQDFKLTDVGPFTHAVKKRIFARDLCKPRKMDEVMKYNSSNIVSFDSSKLNRYDIVDICSKKPSAMFWCFL